MKYDLGIPPSPSPIRYTAAQLFNYPGAIFRRSGSSANDVYLISDTCSPQGPNTGSFAVGVIVFSSSGFIGVFACEAFVADRNHQLFEMIRRHNVLRLEPGA